MSPSTTEKFESFVSQFPIKKFRRNDAVQLAHSPMDFFYFIKSGAVKMTTVSKQGQNLVLTIFYAGATFSLLSLINNGINTYDFIALNETTLYRIPKDEFVTFLQENPDVLYDFQLRLLRGLQGLLTRIEKNTFLPAYSQVAGLLLYFAKHFSESSTPNVDKRIEIQITHQEISEWLGLSRENVSIQMKQLEREGLLRKEEHFILLTDTKKLEEVADTGMS